MLYKVIHVRHTMPAFILHSACDVRCINFLIDTVSVYCTVNTVYTVQ